MLLKRYSNIEYVFKLPIKQAIKLITFAKKQEDREHLLRHYLTIYPNMDKKSYISFEKFYADNIEKPQTQYDHRPLDDLMDEILKVEV